MARFVAWVLAVTMGLGGVAQAKRRHENWKAVKNLASGLPVRVEQQRGAPEDCLLVAVDDATLTCQREADSDRDWRPGENARVVFPRKAVHAVWFWAPVPEPHAGIWIAGTFGFIFGGAFCAAYGPGAIVGCGVLGALIAMGMAAMVEAGPTAYPPRMGWPIPAPQPPSYPGRQRQWQWKLVYRAPAGTAP